MKLWYLTIKKISNHGCRALQHNLQQKEDRLREGPTRKRRSAWTASFDTNANGRYLKARRWTSRDLEEGCSSLSSSISRFIVYGGWYVFVTRRLLPAGLSQFTSATDYRSLELCVCVCVCMWTKDIARGLHVFRMYEHIACMTIFTYR